MQLRALDENGTIITASQALKKYPYRCLECSGIVYLRSGVHRKKHFFHLESTHHCRQNGKGIIHLHIQQYLFNGLPREDCQLELCFPTIQRIADVAWISKKIIFEIQCSPISEEEIEARNRDYQSLGWDVVWIFHDARYNKRCLVAAELAMHEKLHYFTDIDFEGKGMIYDQISIVRYGKRVILTDRFPVDLSIPLYCKEVHIPKLVSRMSRFYFKGDRLDRYLTMPERFYQIEKYMRDYRQKSQKLRLIEKVKQWVDVWVGRPYRLIFQMILERLCR